VATVRQKIVTAARWGIAHEPQIHYGEIRPVPLGRTLPLTTDCSGFVTLCYFLAGALDPNGLDYSGEGWTGTLLGHLDEIEQGDDPLLCSHGQERGPLAVRFSDEDRWQACSSTWLDGLTRSSRLLRPE
jgi:hypothetical protein